MRHGWGPARLAVCFAGLFALSGAACGPPGEPEAFKAMEAPDLAADLASPPPQAGDGLIADAVARSLPAEQKGRAWSDTSGNALGTGWLLQSPPASHFDHGAADLPVAYCGGGEGCDSDLLRQLCYKPQQCSFSSGRCTTLASTVTAVGQAPSGRCSGHSDYLFDEIYQVIASGELLVDVTSLSAPDGSFLGAMRNAVTYLASTGRAVTLRFLFGCAPGICPTAKTLLEELTRDVPAESPITVHVGSYRSSNLPPSWNHSKIVAADGKTAIVGGHNLWDRHYLRDNPVHDVSLRLSGPAAGDAHAFAAQQWRYTCSAPRNCDTGSVCAFRYRGGSIDEQCPAAGLAPPPSSPAGGTRVLGLGRLAYVDPANQSNPSDQAILTMLRQARTTIRMSQQDLGPVKVNIFTGWSEGLLKELGAAVVRGVDVYLVLSNPNAVAGGLGAGSATYSNGWTAEEVPLKVLSYLRAHPEEGAPTGYALIELLCQKLHVAGLRFSGEDGYPDGDTPDAVPYANHAKLVLVDEQAFYIGSQNLYPADLTEYGYLVDNKAAAGALMSDYFAPLWRHSSRVAVSGSEARQCSLKLQME